MQNRNQYILSLFIAISWAGLALKATEVSQSPSGTILGLTDISRLENSLSPDLISQVEIDDALRDRLRFDPQLQEIAQAIREDIMQAKWGQDPVKNPAWKRYGAKAFPLLSYYASSNDETRQKYGIEGIRSLGKPYTTLWLRSHIKRRTIYPDSTVSFFYSSIVRRELKETNGFRSLINVWESEYGLDDPKVRADLIALAKANLEPQNFPKYNKQFNYDFLVELLGYEAVNGKAHYEKDRDYTGVSDWVKYAQLQQPTDIQIQEAIAFYKKQSIDTQDYILTQDLGKFKAGKITPFARAFFRALATEPLTNNKDRIWVIAELDRHGDELGSELLQDILNNDLSQLLYLNRVENNGKFSVKKQHADLLLLGMVLKYPQSKFAIACREYGDLRGNAYFGYEPRSKEILERNTKRTDREWVVAWQDWIDRYSDHPGADDATYYLALSLQDNNEILEAMRVWIKMIVNPMGDRDAIFHAFPHIRILLDVGLSIDQMQTLLKEPENKDFTTLLQYAIAVQYARSQNYAEALEVASNIQIETIPDRILAAYYNSRWQQTNEAVTEFKKKAQSMLSEQKLRWQKLRRWQIENTPEARYQIASDWAGMGGWKNGYLPFWYDRDRRLSDLPIEKWGCEEWWVCDRSRRSKLEIVASYQGASQNAIAISLYQELLKDNSIPPLIREKTLYMVAMTLFDEWINEPLSEIRRIHPPAGVTDTRPYQNLIVVRKSSNHRDYESYEDLKIREMREETQDRSMRSDYKRRIDEIIAELQDKFPQSSYIDDLLFSSFFLTREPHYLQTIVEKYPKSDRAAEAKFLLEKVLKK